MRRGSVSASTAGVGLAALLVVAGQLEVAFGSVGYAGSAPRSLSALLAAPIPLPLAWHRRAPLLSLVGVGLLLALPTLVVDRSIPFWGGLVALDVALYAASRWARPPRDRVAVLVPVVTVALIATAIPTFRTWNEVAFSAVVFGLGWTVGQVMRSWERRHQQLGSDLLTLAESAELRERAAAVGERTRIARELHDVVAHSVGVMVVQAGSARLRVRSDPASAEEALITVEATGREALGELRQLLGLLRTEEPCASVHPQPGLSAVDDLVAEVRRSGLDVTVEVTGPPRPLSPALDLSAYRIVQEALTNVLKHAGPTAVVVRIGYREHELEVQVRNDPGRRSPLLIRGGGGHGLLGMRERAALFSGRVDAGPSPNGGYLVHALLPLPESEPAS